MNDLQTKLFHGVACALCGFALGARAETISADFTGASAPVGWQAINGACLTAGNGSGTVPGCVGLPYYTSRGTVFTGGATAHLPDMPGQGALRLTNGGNSMTTNGAILSTQPFAANQGLDVTFTTVTYGGNDLDGHGADGISFMLLDGARQFDDLGSIGGTLAYSCGHSGALPSGITGGYLGLGIDEYGNFLASTNGGSGVGANPVPNRIGLRGAGNVSWNWLNAHYPNYYPSSLSVANQQLAVALTCTNAHLYDFSGTTPVAKSTQHVPDYAALTSGYAVLPWYEPLAAEAATTRKLAVPISYHLRLTPGGNLSFQYSYNGGAFVPVITDQPIASLSPDNATIPQTFTFGFAASTGAGTNVHEILCFKATPAATAANSGATNIQQSGQLKTGTQVYFAYYHPDNWWGQLTSQNLTYDSTSGLVSIGPANWDGGCTLTGGACAATGTNVTAEAPAQRSILTWDAHSGIGIPFEWSNPPAGQLSALAAGDGLGLTRLAFLRGDRTQEADAGGPFRTRTSVLGDIIDASPTWEGPPAAPYPDIWQDKLFPTAAAGENAGQKYSGFLSKYATRQNVVFVGANDGLMHGFRAGSYDGNGTGGPGDFGNFVDVGNDGLEVLAYVPNVVVQSIHNTSTSALDYSSPNYAHNYYVDGATATGDLFYNGAWHTWLASGLGAGGQAVFALDVTDPSKFAEAKAGSLVLGEWTTALTCSNAANCGRNLGLTFGAPIIRRLHNGSWAMILGNGLASQTGHAGIYVMIIGASGGVAATYFLDTGVGSAAQPDGIVAVTPVDLDGDHISDYVYAGDIYGNVWRFDLTAATPGSWGLNPAVPIFTTPSGQPISTALQVVSTPSQNGAPRVLVEFGTGLSTPMTLSSPVTYATGTQSLYGIWDANFSNWNAKSQAQFASLPGTTTVNRSELEVQRVTNQSSTTPTSAGSGSRTVSSNPVCWKGSSASCGQLGFLLDLPDPGEQVIYNPIEVNGIFIVNTTVPASASASGCSTSNPSGWTMALDATTGGDLPASFFVESGNQPATTAGVPIAGVAMNATGSGSIVSAQGGFYLVNQTSSGSGVVQQVNMYAASSGKRITWIQMR